MRLLGYITIRQPAASESINTQSGNGNGQKAALGRELGTQVSLLAAAKL